MDFDLLTARSLNSSRTIHRPSYVGLRLFLEAARNNPASFLKFLDRRLPHRKSWRYFTFPILKEASESNEFTHRICMTGSPLTIIAESLILRTMAESPLFQPSACVYSYNWPAKKSGRNFEYFFEGYTRRNRHVAALLHKHPDHVAVISDIRRFYPSVDTEVLRRKITEKTSRFTDRTAGLMIERFSDALFASGSRKHSGLPIGPDLSHAFGQIALESVDATMQAAYGNRYFRYVDDIIVVCPRSEVTRAEKRLNEAVKLEHLALHEGKQDVVDANTWKECDPHASRSPDSFESLVESIILFLLKRPDDCASLQRSLAEEGFSLPIRRLGALAKSGRYHLYMRGQLSWPRGLLAWARSQFETKKTLIAKAHLARGELQTLCENYAKEALPPSGMKRRWYAQRRRYIFNRLLYLLDPSRYPSLLESFLQIDEMAEGRLVAQALADRDATAILRCPGRVVDTFCQLWAERHGLTSPTVNWPSQLTWIEAESIAHMSLYFKIDAPTDLIGTLAEKAPGGRMLIGIIRGDQIINSINRSSYLDEMEMLFRGANLEHTSQLMSSRFDEREDFGLDALRLGGAGWSLGI